MARRQDDREANPTRTDDTKRAMLVDICPVALVAHNAQLGYLGIVP